MPALNPQDLLEDSKCYACLGVSLYDQLRLALLDVIAQGGGAGGGFSYAPDSAIVTWTDNNGAGQTGDLAYFNANADYATVTILTIEYETLTSISNIGSSFPMLNELHLHYTGLPAVDLSNLGALTYLDLSYNSITTVDLSECPNLERLFLGYCPITSVDVSTLTSLIQLDVSSTNIPSLDISNLTNLTEAFAWYCGSLSTLLFSNTPSLYYIAVPWCNLSTIDENNLTSAITQLLLNDNNIASVAKVDTIFAKVNSFGTGMGGYRIYLDGGTNAAPTGSTLNPDVMALGSRGWIVVIN